MMTCEELANLERGDIVYQLSTVYHDIDEAVDCDAHITKISIQDNVYEEETDRLYLTGKDDNKNSYTFLYGFKPDIEGSDCRCIIDSSYKNIYRTWGDAYKALDDTIVEWRSFDKEAVQSKIQNRECSYWAITQRVQRDNK